MKYTIHKNGKPVMKNNKPILFDYRYQAMDWMFYNEKVPGTMVILPVKQEGE